MKTLDALNNTKIVEEIHLEQAIIQCETDQYNQIIKAKEDQSVKIIKANGIKA